MILRRRAPRALAAFLLSTVLLSAAGGCVAKGHVTDYVPSDTSLESLPLFFYPVRGDQPARAFVFFLGNDVSFWGAHQQLAWQFSGNGYSVVGMDIRKYLNAIPSDEPRRDSLFGAMIGPVIARVRHEMKADSLPIILAGHSFGAELAYWIAWKHEPPGLIGVLSLNTRASGHLFITPQDWLNKEASGDWSFSTIQAAHDIDPKVKIALVRGAHDPFAFHDTVFMDSAGPRIKHWVIPMAGHSLEKLIVAGPMVQHAIDWITDSIRNR